MKPSLKHYWDFRKTWRNTWLRKHDVPTERRVGHWVLGDGTGVGVVGACGKRPGWLRQRFVAWLLGWKYVEPANVGYRETIAHFIATDKHPFSVESANQRAEQQEKMIRTRRGDAVT